MRSKDKWLKDYPMIDYEKADCKRIRNSVGEKLSEQKGEVIYMKKRSFKPLAIIGAVLAVSAASVFTVNAATDGAVVNKIKEWTGNVTVYINGEEVEMPAKIKEIEKPPLRLTAPLLKERQKAPIKGSCRRSRLRWQKNKDGQ